MQRLIPLAIVALIAIAVHFTSCTKATVQQPQYEQPTTVSISVDDQESITVRIK